MSDTSMTSIPPRPTSSTTSEPISKRLMSVDALRGFDMFWIIGADALLRAFQAMNQNPVTGLIARQLDHAEWEGFRFYDLIFPLFIFIMGVSLVFSLTKQIEKGGRREAMVRLFRRFVLMFVVALVYSGGFTNPWPDMRLLGVLNRIALCYLFGGLIFIFFKPKAMVGIAAALLIGYWATLAFVPMRDIQMKNDNLAKVADEAGDKKTAALFKEDKNFSAIRNSPAWAAAKELFYGTTKTTTGQFEPGYNVANHFDFQHLPGKKWEVYADPEGFLSTVPAIVTCLLGVFSGLLLMS